mmetsp:Transcript_14831/g.60269  ORF Transcript_14831/g.60269 Transcript_14831/m.60269 type:complete len:98 (+) Transcript_14831:440-733(+)
MFRVGYTDNQQSSSLQIASYPSSTQVSACPTPQKSKTLSRLNPNQPPQSKPRSDTAADEEDHNFVETRPISKMGSHVTVRNPTGSNVQITLWKDSIR